MFDYKFTTHAALTKHRIPTNERFELSSALRNTLGFLPPALPDTIARLIPPSTHRRATINILPDDVLLLIFYFGRMTHLKYLELLHIDPSNQPWMWHRLVHVCQRWRSVVFASPNFLDLQLFCNPRTRVELTGIWPPLPVTIWNVVGWPMASDYNFEAAVMHPNCVREIVLRDIRCLELQRLASAMQQPFPALIHLTLVSDHPDPALPDGFLGGSAPRLRTLKLHSVLFPVLPKFLMSATDLVSLHLSNIPHSGYFSTEALVTGLTVMANLELLIIKFVSPLSRPRLENRRPPPPTRIVLPALTDIRFKGVSEYLEDLVARIDAPLLDFIQITFFHQLIFDIPQLAQFMRRTTRFQALNEAHVDFSFRSVQIGYLPPTISDEKSGLGISCGNLEWQLLSVEQVSTSFFPSINMVEHLYIYGPAFLLAGQGMQWIETFHQFPAVKNLYLSNILVLDILHALQELVGSQTTELLPTVQNIFMEVPEDTLGDFQAGLEEFVAARQLSGHPITVSLWEIDSLHMWI